MKLYADTNILVRILVQDDNEQLKQIIALIDSGKYKLLISSAVIIELCWILKSRFKLNNEKIGNAILELMKVENLLFEEETVLNSTAKQFMKTNLDVVDVYLAIKSTIGDTPVLTWDSDFRKLACEYYKPSELI